MSTANRHSAVSDREMGLRVELGRGERDALAIGERNRGERWSAWTAVRAGVGADRGVFMEGK